MENARFGSLGTEVFPYFVETVHTTLRSYTFLMARQIERMLDVIYTNIAVPSFYIYIYGDFHIKMHGLCL